MKLTMHAKALSKKITLISTAFILAVSTLTAVTPFIAAKQASAVANGVINDIDNFADFQAALSDVSVGHIGLKKNVTIQVPVDKALILARDGVRVNGNDSTISKPIATNGWRNGGTEDAYLFKVSKANDVKINSLRMSGGDAGLLVSSSQVTLTGNTHVNGHEFGGIEVSRTNSASGAVASQLKLEGALWNFTTNSEARGIPSVWAVDGQGSVDSEALYQTLYAVTYVKPGQTQYYLNSANADVVATNVSKGISYDNVQTAINSANPNDTIRLDDDVTLANSGYPTIRINKALTFDGNGKTITAPFVRGTAGGENNTALAVVANNVTVKNLSTLSTNTSNPAHGIVVQGANTISGITLQNISTTGATAGVILNGSIVTIDGIATTGSVWYGIGVDLGAQLRIKGANTHTEATHIKVEDKTKGSYVVDLFGKYEKTVTGNVITYVLDANAPVVTGVTYGTSTPLEGSTIKGTQSINATLTDGTNTVVNYTNFELKKDNVWKAQWSAGNSLNPGFNLDTTAYIDGQYTLRAYGRDNNGNTFEKVTTFTIDNSTPVTSITNATVSGDVLSVEGSAKDLNLNYYYCYLTTNQVITVDGHTFTAGQEVRLNNNTTTSRDAACNTTWARGATEISGVLGGFNIAGVPDGTYTIKLVAYDRAGNNNVNNPATYTLTIDRTAPEVVIPNFTRVDNVITPNVQQDGTAVAFKWTPASDNPAGAVISDDESLTPGFKVVGSGSYAFLLTATDAVGNASETLFSFIYTAPVVSAPGVPVNPVVTTTPTTAAVTTPTITGPFSNVLGGSTSIPEAAVEGASDVKGTSTLDNLAQAVDTDSTDGTILGLAWYWWLLILAGIAVILWWIIGALRRRQGQDA